MPIKLTKSNIWNYVDKHGPIMYPKLGHCWIWTRHPKSKNKHSSYAPYRRFWEMKHGPKPNGFCICHKCDNPSCVRISHLFIGTQKDNMADLKAKGRRKGIGLGESNGRAKLSEKQVIEIRRLYIQDPQKWKQVNLAAKFQVNQRNISMILLRRTWHHI